MSSRKKGALGVYRGTWRKTIDVDATDPVPDRPGYRWFNVDDVETRYESWTTFTPDDSPDWLASIRIEPDPAGSLVAVELRVFPRDDPSDVDPNTDYPWLRGEWSRETASIPEGGIGARMLRSIRLGVHLRESRPKATEALKDVPDFLDKMSGFAYSPEDVERWRHSLTTPEVLDQGRGEDYSDVLYARVAALYVGAVNAGSEKPNVDVADQLGAGWKPAKVRDWVRRCRSREKRLMTETVPGVAGGQLTDKARDILKGAEHEEAPNGED